jgi:membrane-bound lytic murein transglycosylase B
VSMTRGPDNQHDAQRDAGSLRPWWTDLRFAACLASLVLALGLAALAWLASGANLAWGNFLTDGSSRGLPAMAAVPPSVRATTPIPAGARSPQPDPLWVDRVAGATAIPAWALMAYARATLLLSVEQPACRVGWNTLAGLGQIESEHGTHAGNHLLHDGRPAIPIIGPALDGGSGLSAIPATPYSIALDGDHRWAHAIGPMQFIPSTWQRWASDGNGDGRSDPNNIHDAAYAAARYLCASGADLSRGQGWQRAIHSYNRSDEYTAAVLDAANQYALSSGKG